MITLACAEDRTLLAPATGAHLTKPLEPFELSGQRGLAVRVGSVRVLALAFCSQQRHNAVVSVQITIRDVPDAVRDELAARAALQGKSMQEYLRAELEHLAARPSVERVLERIRERKATAGTRLSPEEILTHRDADRG